MDNTPQIVDNQTISTHAQRIARMQQHDVRTITSLLKQCPNSINPAIALYWELNQREKQGTLNLEEVLLRQSEIQHCQVEGQRQLDAVKSIQVQLNRAVPQPCNPVVVMV